MPVTRRAVSGSTRASAGERDRLVLVRWRPVADSVEASGLPRDDWSDYRSIYMSRSVQSSDERFVADQVAAADVTRWELEYLADMDPDVADVPKRFQLVYRGRTYDVIAATVVGRGKAIELTTLAPTAIGG